MVGIKKLLTSVSLAATTANVYASAPVLSSHEPYTINCVIRAANEYSIPANIVLAIGSVEGGKEGMARQNQNGTYDLGVFQINTTHWSNGGVMSRTSITQLDVRDNGCFSARVAAWLIRARVDASGGQKSYWTAVADYHSKTPKYNSVYKKKLVSYSIGWGKWMEKNTSSRKIILH